MMLRGALVERHQTVDGAQQREPRDALCRAWLQAQSTLSSSHTFGAS